MEHKIEFESGLTITTQDIVDYVLSCEDGGFDYWAQIGYNAEDYKAARARLIESGRPDSELCYEDILAEILEDGGKLTVTDREDGKDYELTMEKLLDGWKAYIIWSRSVGRSGTDFDEYDAEDADGILQYAIFGEWIYG